MKNQKYVSNAFGILETQSAINEYRLVLTDPEGSATGCASGLDALIKQNPRPVRQEVKDKVYAVSERNTLQGNVHDAITGTRRRRYYLDNVASDPWLLFGEPDRLGSFWDVRFQITEGDNPYEKGTVRRGDDYIVIKEGTQIQFMLWMNGSLWNYGKVLGARTSAHKSAYEALYNEYDQCSGGAEACSPLLEKLNNFVDPKLTPPKPTTGAAYVFTKTLKSKNSNWATYAKDFEAIGTLISVSDQFPDRSTSSLQGFTYFTVNVKKDLIKEPDEVFLLRLKQDQSAVSAVNNWVQEIAIYIQDDTELPEVPIELKFSRAQTELMKTLARDADLDLYISELKEIISDMVDDSSSSRLIEMQARILELYADDLDGNLNFTLSKFLSSSSLAASLIQEAVAAYITEPQARAALGQLKRVKDRKIKAEVEALIVEHSRRNLTTSGSPAANAMIEHMLRRFK